MSGKRREQELENRIHYLEDQLIQMNFNLSMVSNVVDLLSNSSSKEQTVVSPYLLKEFRKSRFRPDSFVMKSRPIGYNRDTCTYHPYVFPKRSISNSYPDLRRTGNTFLKEKRTYSIENLLKETNSNGSLNESYKQEGTVYSSRSLTGHSKEINRRDLHTTIPCTSTCRQCMSSVPKHSELRYCNDSVLTFQPQQQLQSHKHPLSLNPIPHLQNFHYSDVKLPSYYNNEVSMVSPPVLHKEGLKMTSNRKSLTENSSAKKESQPQRNVNHGVSLLCSIANYASSTSEGLVHPSLSGVSLKSMPSIVENASRSCNTNIVGSSDIHVEEDEVTIDIEHDDFDSPSDSFSNKWSDSDDDDCPNGSIHGHHSLSEENNSPDGTKAVSYILPDHCTVMEVIKLWEEGSSTIPPIRRWSPLQRSKQKSKISRWRKIMQIFKEKYDKNVATFLKAYSDSKGRVLPVSAILSIHKDDDSVMDEDYEHIDIGIENLPQKLPNSTCKENPRYVLPRKINGRQVTPLDILKVWERGIDNIPPIKQWTPSQKLKQQSKVSRWKKIVDLYKKDCSGNMTEFCKKFSYEDGKLMPVSVILASCESRRNGNISPKLEE